MSNEQSLESFDRLRINLVLSKKIEKEKKIKIQ